MIEMCLEYLRKQIEILKPKIIITLGISFNYLMKNDEKIVDVSGNIYNYNNSKLVPLLDPEFIYKNPSYKAKLFNDLKKIKLLMENG